MIWTLSLLGLLLQLPGITCAETARTTECFVKKIPREEFNFKISKIDDSVPIEFSASLVGGSDPPLWMKITQSSLYHHPFIYGTPDSSVLQGKYKDTQKKKLILKIQVLAKNTETYETDKKKLTIRILPKRAVAVFESEVVIRNFDISEFLEDDLRADLLRRFKRLWNNTEDIYYTKISSLLDEGGRLPLPMDDAESHDNEKLKNGVLVRLGSRHHFMDELRYVRVNTTSYMTQACAVDESEVMSVGSRLDAVRDSVSIDEMFYPDYHIDWCQFRLITKQLHGRRGRHDRNNRKKPHGGGGIIYKDGMNGDGENRYVDNPLVLEKELSVEFVNLEHVQDRDVLPDIILCLLLPLIILIILLIILTCLFFCYRQGNLKRLCVTPPIELSQYAMIHRVSDSLRLMSDKRDSKLGPPVAEEPPPTSPQPTNASTPSRTESAPPPYTTPSPSGPSQQQDSSPEAASGDVAETST